VVPSGSNVQMIALGAIATSSASDGSLAAQERSMLTIRPPVTATVKKC
jgi:hypothetical protein